MSSSMSIRSKKGRSHSLFVTANLAVLLNPFLPFSSQKIINWLGLKTDWKAQYVNCGYEVHSYEILYSRIDKSVIEGEIVKLQTGK